MLNRFEGKIIAVAGSGGIGSSVCKRLAQEGASVVVGDINMQAAEQTVADIEAAGGKALAARIDIGDEASVKAFVQTAKDVQGGIDGFFVNALDSTRTGKDLDAIEIDMEDYDYLMHRNLRSYFLCTHHAVPELIARGGGCMLYTSSGAAYQALDRMPVYAMGKSALHALARHVASRWGKQGVRGNVIAPGLMVHPAVKAIMSDAIIAESLKSVPSPKIGKPEDIAAMAALLLSDDGAYVQGQVICVDGGATMRP